MEEYCETNFSSAQEPTQYQVMSCMEYSCMLFSKCSPFLLYWPRISFSTQHNALPALSYKYQLQQTGSHKYKTGRKPRSAIFFIGELAVSLLLVSGNVCTPHFLVGNDVELFSKIASLNGEIFIKGGASLRRGETLLVGGSFGCQRMFVSCPLQLLGFVRLRRSSSARNE